MPKPTPFDDDSAPLPQRIAVGLSKVGLSLKFQAVQAAGARGLSPTQGQVLALLLTSRTGLRPSTLAERLAVTPPTVTDSVKALEAKGLVERRADADDARVSLVVLTARGRGEAKASASWPDFLASAVDVMAPAEQEVFFRGLVKMISTLQREGRIPVSAMCVTCTHFRPNAYDDALLPHHCTYVNAPMGARHLRLECAEHEEAPEPARTSQFAAFTG
ncbi:MAG: winged helix-turn-helix transcriptional regulator [Myxococcaceae bacterium]|jgi:DNA-binding MarR family transcriptional regulator|nr:winged helix-turn-helix transcriptional regulator [Myxococcaceae bacterium]MCA3014930.1 winged helix-turn-helix transcriptional regulator [Myxococcaceae bacterium]